MPCCCVPCCTNRSETKKKGIDGITFHLFPRDSVKRQRWTAAVGREGWRPSSASVVCSRHFPAACFYRTRGGLVRLLDHSLPVLHIPREDRSESPWEPNSNHEDDKRKSKKNLELGRKVDDTKNELRGASDFSGKCVQGEIESQVALQIFEQCEDKSDSQPVVGLHKKCENGDSETLSERKPAVLRAPFLEPGAPAKALALAAHVRRMQQLLKRQRKSIRQLQQCLRERRSRLRSLQCPSLCDGHLPDAEETSDCDDAMIPFIS